MNPRSKKVILLLLAAAFLAGVSQVQRSMNADRARLQLTRTQPLENAPPVLAFTTVALGGFRGLISNMLWIRASTLQEEDKFFEAAQLADWITKLEPHFVQVWLFQAWNMAYNISVKFKDYPDRWRWVRAGIELLRDSGLPYNENEVLIYRELAWLFQHKMGAHLDDASMYYKQEWANEMAEIFGSDSVDLAKLAQPQTDDDRRRAALLRSKYKMNPEDVRRVDQQFGPLEWRLPEAHAIYWAAIGLDKAKLNPGKVKPEDFITLRRAIYQSMQMSFQRGRLEANPFTGVYEFGPNLDIIPKVNAAYEQAMEEDKPNRDHIQTAHRNFLRDAIYFLYVNNRIEESAQWFRHVARLYPDKTMIDEEPDSYPRNLTLDHYAVTRVAGDINETSPVRVQAAVEGLLVNSYRSLALGQDARAVGFKLLAQKVWDTYTSKLPRDRQEAMKLTPFRDTDLAVLNRLLDPDRGVQPEARAILRSRLGLPAEPPPKPAPPAGAPTAP